MEPDDVALDFVEKTSALALAQKVVIFHESLSEALDDCHRSAEFMGGIGNKLSAEVFQALACGDVVKDKEGEDTALAIFIWEAGSTDFKPEALAATAELQLFVGAIFAFFNGADIVQKDTGLDEAFEAAAKEGLLAAQELAHHGIGHEDVVVAIDNEDGLADVAKGGLNLAEVVVLGAVDAGAGSDEVIAGFDELLEIGVDEEAVAALKQEGLAVFDCVGEVCHMAGEGAKTQVENDD